MFPPLPDELEYEGQLRRDLSLASFARYVKLEMLPLEQHGILPLAMDREILALAKPSVTLVSVFFLLSYFP